MLRALVIASLMTVSAGAVSAQDFFTLKGHGGPIMDVTVSPTGQIATASFDNAVGLWADGTAMWLDGHEAAVNTVVFLSPDVLASAGDDFAVRLWSADSGGVVMGTHTAKVMSLAVCQGTTTLVASASWDSTISIWDMGPLPGAALGGAGDWPKRTVLAGHTAGVNDVVFSQACDTLYSASTDGTIRAWDVGAGAEKHRLVEHGFGVNELALNDAENWLAYGAVDGGTRMVNPQTGAEIADFTLDRRPILSMSYDPNTAQLAVGDGEGFIMVVDTKKRAITRDFRATQRGPIWALAFSKDGQNIHAGGIEDIVYSWPVATLTEHGQMAGQTRSFLEDPASLPNGERQFKRKCSICHTVTPGSARKAGPSLHQLFGRQAGTVPDYAYSDTLMGSDIIWSDDTINGLFDEGPDHYIPGTKMPMQRIAKQTDRDDLIDYLRVVTAPGEK